MKITLAGWNENTYECLAALIANSFLVTQVLVPKGFDSQNLVSLAHQHNIPTYEIKKNEEFKALLDGCDLFVSASWPFIIAMKNLSEVTHGGINIHGSLLPKYRGAHPLNWAIINGEKECGVTAHYITQGLDTGDICAQVSVSIMDNDTLLSLRDKCHKAAGEVVLITLNKLVNNNLIAVPQDESKATFAPYRHEKDHEIDWNQSSLAIFNFIRASSYPARGAFSYLNNQKIIFWSCSAKKNKGCYGKPGEILAFDNDTITISTGMSGLVQCSYETELEINVGDILSSNSSI